MSANSTLLDNTTAVAGDIVAGKTAYNGDEELVTGTLYDAGSEPTGSGIGQYNPGDGLYTYIYLPNESTGEASFSSAKVTRSLKYPAHEFGNASASDLRVGKTMTCKDGVRVAGTLQIPTIKFCEVANIPQTSNYRYTIPTGTLIGISNLSTTGGYVGYWTSGNTIYIDVTGSGYVTRLIYAYYE